MLKLGYKASAEQFAPTELLRYGVLAEECGFDSVFVSDHLQPWRHDGGHAPAALPWLGALGARTERVRHRHLRADPDVPLPPGGRRAGVRDPRLPVPGPGRPRHRLRRVAQRGAARHRVARRQGALRPAQGGGQPDQAAVDRGPGHLRGHLLPHRQGHDLRPPGAAGADLHRRLRPGGDPAAGRIADGYITTCGKAPALYTDTLLPAVREGAEKAGRDVGRHRHDDRGQGLLRPRPRRGPAGHPLLGRARR